MLTLPDIARSRYLLHRGVCDAGFPAIRAALAVEVLIGPEPDQVDDEIGEPLEWHPAPDETFWPDPSDEADYLDWSARLEAPYPAEYPALLTDADLAAAGLPVG